MKPVIVLAVALLVLLTSCRSLTTERPNSFIVVTSNSWSEGNLPEDCFTFTTEEKLTVLVVNCSGIVTLWLYRDERLWSQRAISARANEVSYWVIGNLPVGEYKLRANTHEGDVLLGLENRHYPLSVVAR